MGEALLGFRFERTFNGRRDAGCLDGDRFRGGDAAAFEEMTVVVRVIWIWDTVFHIGKEIVF